MEKGLRGPPLTVVVLIGVYLEDMKSILPFVLGGERASLFLYHFIHPSIHLSIDLSIHP